MKSQPGIYRFSTLLRVTLVCLVAALSGFCDSLLLRNGTTVTGQWISGDARIVRFSVDNIIKTYRVDEIRLVKFEDAAASGNSTPEASAAGRPTTGVSEPAGTASANPPARGFPPVTRDSAGRQRPAAGSISSLPPVQNGDISFSLQGCARSDLEVTCAIDVRNLSEQEKTVLFLSASHGPFAMAALWRYGRTRAIDSQGREYVADSADLAGTASAANGQTLWSLVPDTSPRLSIVLRNVPLDVSSFDSLDLGVAEKAAGSYTKLAASFSGVQIGSGTTSPIASPTSAMTNTRTSQAVDTNGYRFSLSGCRRRDMDVICEIQVQNKQVQDRRFLLVTKEFNGAGLSAVYNQVGLSQAVDASGRRFFIENGQFGNLATDPSGQSTWPVFQGTTPTLTLTFKNVGLTTTAFSRIALRAADATDRSNLTAFLILFQNIAISGSTLAGAPIPPGPDSGPNVRELHGWRFRLTSCAFAAHSLQCSLDITNLTDVGRQLRMGSRDNSTLARFVTADGSLYVARSGALETGDRWPVGLLSAAWTWKPYQKHTIRASFGAMPTTATKAVRIDFLADFAANQSAFASAESTIRFADVDVGTGSTSRDIGGSGARDLGNGSARGSRVSGVTGPPLNVQGSRDADESLFLLNSLEHLYAAWMPTDETARQAAWLQIAREQATHTRDLIRQRNVSPDLGLVYDDFLKMLPSVDAYVKKLQAIDQDMQTQATKIGSEALTKGLVAGMIGLGAAGIAGEDSDASIDEASSYGAGVAADSALGKSQAVGEQLRARTLAARKALAPALENVKADLRIVVAKLTTTKHWAPGEGGFDKLEGRPAPSKASDRPRDPYVLVRFAMRQYDANDPAQLLAIASTLAQAADMTPALPAYDPFRASFLADAAMFATAAVDVERRNNSSGATPSVPQAAQFCRAYLHIKDKDWNAAQNVNTSQSCSRMLQ